MTLRFYVAGALQNIEVWLSGAYFDQCVGELSCYRTQRSLPY